MVVDFANLEVGGACYAHSLAPAEQLVAQSSNLAAIGTGLHREGKYPSLREFVLTLVILAPGACGRGVRAAVLG